MGRSILFSYFLFLIIVIIIAPFVAGDPRNRNKNPKKKNPTSVQPKQTTAIAIASTKGNAFTPIVMKKKPLRTGKAVEDYRAKLLKSYSPAAKKNNPNMVITGESCAFGTGSWYKV